MQQLVKRGLGLIHVYTGEGKGKTTAALGLALRAVGQGFWVYVIQFMKGGAYTGEMISALNFLPHCSFVQYGRGCIKQQKQLKLMGYDPEKEGHKAFNAIREDIECGACRWCFLNDDHQKQFVRDAFLHAQKVIASGDYALVILDEVNVAVSMGYISVEEMLGLLDSKPTHVELVLTGRNVDPRIVERSDLVTEMKMVKHYFDKGVMARRGIEY